MSHRTSLFFLAFCVHLSWNCQLLDVSLFYTVLPNRLCFSEVVVWLSVLTFERFLFCFSHCKHKWEMLSWLGHLHQVALQ